MSMSSEASPATAKQPLGTSLWLLIGMLLMTGTFELVFQVLTLVFYPQTPGLPPPDSRLVAIGIAHGVSPLLAALALGLWRQRVSLYVAVVFVWLAPTLLIGPYIQAAAGVGDIGITLQQLPFVAMSSGLVAATGCTALLLATPLARSAFPARHAARPEVTIDAVPIDAVPIDGASSAGLRKLAWLVVLILFMLLPLLALVLRYGQLLTVSLGAEDFWHSGELPLMMIAAGVALPLSIAAILLAMRRRWSSITLASMLLWALPVGALITRIAMLAIPQAALVQQWANEFNGVGFTFLAAVGWIGYFKESPVIHRLYPGHRRRPDLVTDVDVF